MTWAKALAWRLGRQLLDPSFPVSVVDVVGRLGAVPAWPDLTAELTAGARRAAGRNGDVVRALEAGELVKAYVFRGATHYMTPRDAGDYLALRASSRMWERRSWVSYYGLAPEDWPSFREYVRGALAEGPLTRSELAAALGRSSRYRHLCSHVVDGNDTLLKPLAWQGDMSLGPTRDGEVTFRRLDSVLGWGGMPDVDEAGPRVVEAYFRIYGPAAPDRVHAWLGAGLGVRRKLIAGWLDGLGERLVTVAIEGERVLVLREDLDALEASRASRAVRLLPARDPWVMGPGTDDPHVVPPARREPVSRSANLIIARGVVAGTWTIRDGRLCITWFAESGRVPRAALAEECARLSRFLDRPLGLSVA
jgi:DNA glycosylase AlkZ-like